MNTSPIWSVLKELADRIEREFVPQDKGYYQLLVDLVALLQEAVVYEFHDFRNTQYAAPKMELVNKLNALIEKTKNGDYDN